MFRTLRSQSEARPEIIRGRTQQVQRRVVHFLLHVPKCAGKSVEGHFNETLEDGYLRAPRWHNPLRSFIGDRYSISAGDPRLKHLRVVAGHALSVSLKRHFPDAEIRESVLLRDPVAYHLSLYNYRVMHYREGKRAKPPGFSSWYLAQRRNPISRFILNHYFDQGFPAIYRLSSADRLAWLEDRLRDFWYVGSYRHASEMIAGISRELGVVEQAARRNIGMVRDVTDTSLDESMRQRIVTENAVDQALWDRWADRGWKADRKNPTSPPPPLPGNDRLRYARSDIATLFWRMAIR